MADKGLGQVRILLQVILDRRASRPSPFHNAYKEECLWASLPKGCSAYLPDGVISRTYLPLSHMDRELRQFSYLQLCGKACAVNLESTCSTSNSSSDELFRYILEELAKKNSKTDANNGYSLAQKLSR